MRTCVFPNVAREPNLEPKFEMLGKVHQIMDYILIGVFVYLLIGLLIVEGGTYLDKRQGKKPLTKLARVITQVGWIFLFIAIILKPSPLKK